jgi:hypothetical protein
MKTLLHSALGLFLLCCASQGQKLPTEMRFTSQIDYNDPTRPRHPRVARLHFASEDVTMPATKLFEKFDRKEFIAPLSTDEFPRVVSGPMVPLDDGREIHCATLDNQGELVAAGGRSSFDVAFKHLDDKRIYMRWIAAEALIRITGKEPLWYWFGTPGKPFNGDDNWSSRAKTEWMKWKAEQAGADQPATKPADKSPVKDQPSTPTSKDAPR